MLPDRLSNPGPLTYESSALPIALRDPAATGFDNPFRVVLGRAYRGLTGRFLLPMNFSVVICVSPHVGFILVLILISVFLR